MSPPSALIQNRDGATVAAALRRLLQGAEALDLASPQLSLPAFAELAEEIAEAGHVRVLVPDSPDSRLTYDTLGLLGGPADRPVRNALKVPALARNMENWLASRAEVRATSTAPRLAYYATRANSQRGILHGSSMFTRPDLGLAPPDGPVMNTLVRESGEAEELQTWFDELWSDPRTRDAKRDLVDLLDRVHRNHAADFVYSLVLYHLFGDEVEDLDEDAIVNPRTGIKDTLVWNKLYRFQRDGVLGAIDKIERYNGCIIADSVGLGKTFEALAIIKYYELRNDRVLVICPKRLRDNWTLYTVNDRRNLFAGDRFNFDVLNHTDLTRTSGTSGGINLETLNWGNYDLVVIDESHNFRNSPPEREGGLTRYGRLMRDVIKTGVRTKVLMLSATPVNSRMNDLKNQIAFITEGRDDAFWNHGVPSLEQTMKRAQARFNHWMSLGAEERTTDRLLDVLELDYFRVLDLLTIARSRRHIEKYYSMEEVGDFPERRKPLNPRPDIDLEGRFPPLREINRDIRLLNLAAYAPLKYVRSDRLEQYSKRYDLQLGGASVFRQIDREESLIHLMRVNLFKRMESSIHSFAATVDKILTKVRVLRQRLEDHEQAEVEELDIEDIDIEAEEFQPFLTGNKIKVLIQDVDRIRWRQELEEDEERLVRLLREARAIDAQRDAKLAHLKEFIRNKHHAPFNPENRKVLIFTAFSDTAQYIYEHVAAWANEELGLEAALLTGADGNRSTLNVGRDQSTILLHFSPRSKERELTDGDESREIDVLVATDCISEGQNLQDCDCVINFDIHWNPVRIIQRFGRIDRLGSKNQSIQLVNYWPNMQLEEYIDLEARVAGRMVLLDISATGEENLIEVQSERMRDLEYRRKQLEQLQESVLDLEDLSGGIFITDMTFNPFRMDLIDRLRESEAELQSTPMGIRAAVRVDENDDFQAPSGAVFLVRQVVGASSRTDPEGLSPHHLVYVSDSGGVEIRHDQPRKLLELLKRLALGRSTTDDQAFQEYIRQTKDESNLSHYQELLAAAIDDIVGQQAQRGVETLFEPGGTVTSAAQARGLEDFEVVAWVALI